MSLELAALTLVERLLSEALAGWDDTVPVERIEHVRRVCQTQAEMIREGIAE